MSHIRMTVPAIRTVARLPKTDTWLHAKYLAAGPSPGPGEKNRGKSRAQAMILLISGEFGDPLLSSWPGTQAQSRCPGPEVEARGWHLRGKYSTTKEVKISLLES